MNRKRITNLAELRRRKEELHLEMKITRQAFTHSLRQTRQETKRAFINGILIPMGLGSIASLFFSQQRASGDKPDWLLFVEQAVGTVGKFYEQPETENRQADVNEKEEV